MIVSSSPGKLYYELGVSLSNASRYQDAIDALNKSLVDNSPDVPQARVYLELGKCYAALNKPKQALEAFDNSIKGDEKLKEEIQGEIIKMDTGMISTSSQASIFERFANLIQRVNPSPPPIQYKKVDALISQNKNEEAEKQLCIILQTWPDDIPSLEKLGYVLRQQDKLSESIGAYKKAINKSSGNVETYFQLGEIYLQTGKYDDAIGVFSNGLEISPGDSRFLIERGKASRLAGKLEQGEKDLRLAVEKQPDNTEGYLELSDILVIRGQTKEATDVLLKGAKTFLEGEEIEKANRLCGMAMDLEPKNPAGLDMSGQILHKQGHTEEALKVLVEAASLSNEAPIYVRIAQIYSDNGEFQDALNAINNALDRYGDQKDAQALIIKGKILRKIDENDKALESLEEALKLDPNQAEGYIERGLVLEKLGNEEEAIKSFREAIRVDPKCQLAYANLGKILFETDRLEEALEVFDKAINLQEVSWFYTIKAKTLFDLQRYEEAIPVFDQALQMDANDIEANLYRGVALRSIGKYEDGLSSIQLAIDLSKAQGLAEDPRSFSELAETLRSMGRNQEAKFSFIKARRLYKDSTGRDDPWTLSRYGTVLFNLEDYKKAIKMLSRAVKLDENDEWSWSVLGAAHLQDHNYKSALHALEEAIKLYNEDFWTWAYKGEVLLNIYRYEEAIAAFDRALELNSSISWIYVDKGIAQRFLDPENLEQALATIERAREIAPNDAYSCYQRGICLFLMQKYKEALAVFEESFRLDDNLIAVHQYRGIIFESQGFTEKAESAYSMALKEPNNYSSYLERGTNFAEVKIFNKAEADFITALKMTEDAYKEYKNAIIEEDKGGKTDKIDESEKVKLQYAECLNALAWFYVDYKSDNLEYATALSQKAVDLASDTPDKRSLSNYFDTLGWAYHKQNKDAQSALLLTEAYRLNPEDLRINYHLSNIHRAVGIDVSIDQRDKNTQQSVDLNIIHRAVGIDVSTWQRDKNSQQSVDFNKAKMAGASFTFLKASQGLYRDPDFTMNWQNAGNSGILRDVYHYLDFKNKPRNKSPGQWAIDQAVFYWGVVKDLKLDFAPVCVYEDTGGLSVSTVRQAFKDFLESFFSLSGKRCIIYTGPSFWVDYGSADQYWLHYQVWWAQYFYRTVPANPNLKPPFTTWLFWQYTDKGDGPTFGCGNKQVNVNYYKGTVDELYAFANVPLPDAKNLDETVAKG